MPPLTPLSARDCNVITVDWSALSGPAPHYAAAAANARPVGRRLARFAASTLCDRRVGMAMGDVEVVVGFSLGAQVAGNMGNALEGRLRRVSGLDPAGSFTPLSLAHLIEFLGGAHSVSLALFFFFILFRFEV